MKKQKPFKIIISPHGEIASVYSDKMELHELGKVYIRRATEVKFNNEEQCWDVISLPPYFPKIETLATGFVFRTDAIAWEVDFLNANLSEIINGYQRSNLIREKEVCESAGR